MDEFKNKSDYAVTIFSHDRYIGFMGYVDNMRSLCHWLDRSRNYSQWDTINVYARRSRRFIAQYKRGQFIPFSPR